MPTMHFQVLKKRKLLVLLLKKCEKNSENNFQLCYDYDEKSTSNITSCEAILQAKFENLISDFGSALGRWIRSFSFSEFQCKKS